MDEEFQGRIHFVVDRADFLQVQLAGEDQLRETGLVEELGPFQRADIGLGAGMDLDGRNIQLHDAHVLHDQRVNADLVQLLDQRARCFQFVVVQDGVQRDEHPRVEQMGKFHQLGDVGHAVLGVVPGTKAGAADVHRIGAMQDGLAGDAGVTGRGEQFEMVLGKGHGHGPAVFRGRAL